MGGDRYAKAAAQKRQISIIVAPDGCHRTADWIRNALNFGIA
jgi:hypothetical protein